MTRTRAHRTAQKPFTISPSRITGLRKTKEGILDERVHPDDLRFLRLLSRSGIFDDDPRVRTDGEFIRDWLPDRTEGSSNHIAFERGSEGCRLVHLILWGARLEELPPEISLLSELDCLYVNAPNLRSLPSSIGKLRRLTVLCFVDCQRLEVVPSEIGML